MKFFDGAIINGCCFCVFSSTVDLIEYVRQTKFIAIIFGAKMLRIVTVALSTI